MIDCSLDENWVIGRDWLIFWAEGSEEVDYDLQIIQGYKQKIQAIRRNQVISALTRKS